MKHLQLYSVLLLLLPVFVVANTPWKGKYTKEKTIKKEFEVSSNALLKVDNSYGNLDVITWEENKIAFEIIIKTNGNNEEKVKDKLDDITVDFNSSKDMVSAKTIFNKSKSNSWWKWNKRNNVNMKVDYIIKIPISNNVNLNNDYGNINLDRLNGHAKLNCDYGKITTKELMGRDNDIKFDYSSNCYFEFIESGTITADYSGFTVAKTKDLDIKADYTKSHVEIAEIVNYQCDYGGLTIDKANSIEGNSNYLTLILGDVYKTLSLNSDFGSIKVKRLKKSIQYVSIQSDYTGIKIGYESSCNFNFDINLQYASLRDSDNFNFIKKRVNGSDKYYTGYYGTNNSGNTITVKSDYGSVSFFQN